jgi:hypothetical protein
LFDLELKAEFGLVSVDQTLIVQHGRSYLIFQLGSLP